MATMNAPANERRHIPERRNSGSALHSTHFSAMDWLAMVLMIVGGLNWGLVGAFEFDLVAALFGDRTIWSRLVYALVGIASLYGIYLLSKMAARQH
ncbi:hypothetical protein CR152_09395 [Massilia violaceinigra]|uniref:DUF378 domain-containing protein n=1 Tax=Massilia violaceinigra TaxID=2045208 RepID=A0A2D2DIA6_9BURK|nr:DUF378 domain-containing protein [Massilia violaceinigra]ATQ74712.1 hypothetical protein CR152_09395 [Massilia violaceinigra]